MMTRRDYQQIALTISELDIPRLAKKKIVHGLADMFSTFNPHFDTDWFHIACGVPRPIRADGEGKVKYREVK